MSVTSKNLRKEIRGWEMKQFEVFIPLNSLPTQLLVGTGYIPTGYPLLQLSSLKVPETTPLPGSSRPKSTALTPELFHHPSWSSLTLPSSATVPSSPHSYCWSAPRDNWYTQRTTFCLPRWLLSPLNLEHGFFLCNWVLYVSTHGLIRYKSIPSGKILNHRLTLNCVTSAYKLYVILDWIKPN